MKEKINYKIVIGKVGKNPEQDWLLVLAVFVLLVVVVIVVSATHFFDIKSFIKTGLINNESLSGQSVKTKEEELRDVINIYVQKKSTHEALLGRSKTDVEKPPATTTASTTGTEAGATNSSAPSVTSATTSSRAKTLDI